MTDWEYCGHNMSEFLFQYHPVAPTTWFFLSSLLVIALFFKFNRVLSIRNIDLVLLILLAPGMLILHAAYLQEQAPTATGAAQSDLAGNTTSSAAPTPPEAIGPSATVDSANVLSDADRPVVTVAEEVKWQGYMWLLGAEALLLVRLLMDPSLTRRPMLSPNLTMGGLTFMALSLFLFLMATVIVSGPRLGEMPEEAGPYTRMDRLVESFADRGPGYVVLSELPLSANRTIAVVAHSAILLGLVLIGLFHFQEVISGIGAGMLYLMLPYTTQFTGRIDHFLPAAFLVWAVLCYRRPLFAGLFLGTAAGCIYYPLFLLPLWLSFYQQKGWLSFSFGVALALTLLTLGLIFTPSTPGMTSDLMRMFGLILPAMSDLEGIWNDRAGGFDPSFRLPLMAIFVALSCSMALWPVRKTLASLISCSAAIMLFTQFWHGWGGGLYIAWFLPLAVLAIFRPNLEDRTAAAMLQSWGKRRVAAE